MPEMISDSSRMLTEKRSIAWRSGASSSTISTKSPPIGAGPTTRMHVVVAAHEERLERVDDGAVPDDTSRMSMSCCTIGGISETASRRRCVAHLHRDRPGADRCRESAARQRVRHHAARRRLQHQRGGVRGGEPVVEPVQAEVGDRRHVDQHFRDHHEQDREDEQLAGQAQSRRARRSSGCVGCCLVGVIVVIDLSPAAAASPGCAAPRGSSNAA